MLLAVATVIVLANGCPKAPPVIPPPPKTTTGEDAASPGPPPIQRPSDPPENAQPPVP
jgi:hypothetical protein